MRGDVVRHRRPGSWGGRGERLPVLGGDVSLGTVSTSCRACTEITACRTWMMPHFLCFVILVVVFFSIKKSFLVVSEFCHAGFYSPAGDPFTLCLSRPSPHLIARRSIPLRQIFICMRLLLAGLRSSSTSSPPLSISPSSKGGCGEARRRSLGGSLLAPRR
ncbi:hypothetical protein LZ30DRAFT_736732 [Colletotrichum cereale]|nr:hypothetical protein LZ30DRAFT_736732 [Colletotrichum cereale]